MENKVKMDMNNWVTAIMDYSTITAIRNVTLSKIVEYDQSDLAQYSYDELLRLHYLIDLYYIVSRIIEIKGEILAGLSMCREIFVEWKMQSLPDRYEIVKSIK